MVAQAHQPARVVELITNGILLNAGMAQRLMEAGSTVCGFHRTVQPQKVIQCRPWCSAAEVIANLEHLAKTSRLIVKQIPARLPLSHEAQYC